MIVYLSFFFHFIDVCVIEFQKRGLPYTYMLTWLHSNFKSRTTEDVDSSVSAKIPDKFTDLICYEIVSRFMIHGPCGLTNPKSQCMNEGVCSKRFPKKFKLQTVFDDNGFVYYRCRDLKDNFVIKNSIQLNNRYGVSYNRELLLRYNAHINIEICC